MPVTITKKARTPPDLKAKIAAWRKGSKGFFRFLEDVKPVIMDENGKWVPYTVPNAMIRAEIAKALDGEARTIVFCWPRRHGKTVVVAFIILWRFLTRQNETVALVANSKQQTIDTCFRTIRAALERTPYTRDLIQAGAVEVTSDVVRYPAVNNSISGYPNSPASLYGLKLSIAQVPELHAARDPETLNILAGSTLDRADGLVLIDSTVGARNSPLWTLWQARKQGEPGIHFSYITYPDLETAAAQGPGWISVPALRTLAATMLPALFAQQHLNQWQASESALFPPDVVKRCVGAYPLDVSALTDKAAYAVGGGLDRAYGFSLHGDSTVTTAVLRVLEGEEDHFYVLASDVVKFSSASGIKGNFTRYRDRFGLSRAAIESYNAQDISAWCADQAFEHEVVHPTAERQSNAFTTLFNAASEGRLHIHPGFKALLDEMRTFEYRLEATQKGSLPKFEAARGSRDDHVYSLAWAVYSLRDVELNPYEIDGIHCDAPGPVARMCVLNGSELEPPCADSCASMKKAIWFYKSYIERGHLCPLSLSEFVKSRVVNIGSHSVRR